MRVMEKSARNAIFKGFFQNSLLGTFESKQTLRQQIKKQTFPKATFQRILRILLGNEVYHTEDRLSNRERGSLAFLTNPDESKDQSASKQNIQEARIRNPQKSVAAANLSKDISILYQNKPRAPECD